MTTTPAIVRYRGLLLPLIVVFGLLTLLAIPTMIVIGYWPLAILAVSSLVASLILYGAVKDYRP